MFRKETSPTYFYPVILAQLNANGAVVKGDFLAEFPRLKESEFKAIVAPTDGSAVNDEAVIGKVFLGGKNALDGDGQPADLTTPELRAKFLDETVGAGKAVVKAWLKSNGIEGPAKN